MEKQATQKLAIRFGLGAIKAVGLNMMQNAANERIANGPFKDIYDFAERLDPKTINKKSIEALSKAGAFDKLNDNRHQLASSFDIISAYGAQKHEAASSNQMSLFGGLGEDEKKPELKKVEKWSKDEKLKKEFEAFGFFLNEHPIDDHVSDLKRRGVIFSDRLNDEDIEDNSLIKMAGVVAGSKHRSSARGRFAYLTVSDHLGIYEVMIFDEELITNHRDLLEDGSVIEMDCLIKKDEGGTRILMRDVKNMQRFIQDTQAKKEFFEDIKKQKSRRNFKDNAANSDDQFEQKNKAEHAAYQEKIENLKAKKCLSSVQIIIKERTPLMQIKSLLMQNMAPDDFEKYTTVSFSVMRQSKIYKIELAQKYLLDNADSSRLQVIDGVIDVEGSF